MLRVTRLYPLVATGALIGFLLLPAAGGRPGGIPTLVSGLLLMPAPLGSPSMELPLIAANPVSWSLLLELAANLCFALCLPWLTNARLGLLIYASFAVLAVITLGYGGMDIGSLWSNAIGGPPRAFFSFFAGVAIHRAHRADWIGKRGLRPRLGLALLVVIFMLPHGNALTPLLDLAAVGLAFPAIVAGGIEAEPGRWRGACKLAGSLSYPAYILQGGFYPFMATTPTALGVTGIGAPALSVVMIAAYLGFAWIVLTLVDQPIQRALSRFTRKAIAAAVPARV